MKDKTYLKYIYFDSIIESLKIDEGLNKDIIIQPSNFKMKFFDTFVTADYEWKVGNHDFFLFSNQIGPTSYEFKFTNYDGEINTTRKLNVPATSVFSGAILAIKKFLENRTVEYFRIEADKKDKSRVSLYRKGIPVLADQTNSKFLDEEIDEDFVRFYFKIST